MGSLLFKSGVRLVFSYGTYMIPREFTVIFHLLQSQCQFIPVNLNNTDGKRTMAPPGEVACCLCPSWDKHSENRSCYLDHDTLASKTCMQWPFQVIQNVVFTTSAEKLLFQKWPYKLKFCNALYSTLLDRSRNLAVYNQKLLADILWNLTHIRDTHFAITLPHLAIEPSSEYRSVEFGNLSMVKLHRWWSSECLWTVFFTSGTLVRYSMLKPLL